MLKITRIYAFLLAIMVGFTTCNINLETTYANNNWNLQNANTKQVVSNDYFQTNKNETVEEVHVPSITLNLDSPMPVSEMSSYSSATHKGAIKMFYTYNDGEKEIIFDDVPWKLYKIALLADDGYGYDYSNSFKSFTYLDQQGNVGGLDESGSLDFELVNLEEYAEQVEKYIDEKDIYFDRYGKTDTRGYSEITNLEDGLYLLIFVDKAILNDELNDELNDDGSIGILYYSDPILLSIPGFNYSSDAISEISVVSADTPSTITADGDWSYSQEVYAKINYMSIMDEEKLKQVVVEKIWGNDDGLESSRPEVHVELYKNNDIIPYDKQVLNASNNWYYKWTNLSNDDWSIEEAPIDNYDMTLKPFVENIISDNLTEYYFEIENTYNVAPKYKDVTVEKVWSDNNNADSTRPDYITIRLLRNGKFHEEIQLEDGKWSYTWNNLSDDYDWTVYEVAVANYTTNEKEVVVTNTTADLTSYYFEIENTYVPNIKYKEVTVEKVWSDNNDAENSRPDYVTIELLKDGNYDREVKLEEGKWSHTWENLSNENDWTVREVAVAGYTTNEKNVVVTNTTADLTSYYFEIENIYIPIPKYKEVSVEKVWLNDDNNSENTRPEYVTIELLKDGNYDREVKLEEGKWSYTWENLSNENDWTVREIAVADYTTNEKEVVVTNTTADLTSYYFEIENIYKSLDKMLVSVEKNWNDNNNSSNLRPENIKVGLYNNGVLHGDIVTLEEGEWSHIWYDLDVHDNWNVQEVGVPSAYTSSKTFYKDGNNYIFKIENSYTPTVTPQKIYVEVEKIWEDDNDKNGIRPESVVVGLYYGSGSVLYDTKELNKNNNWSYLWTDLSQYDWSIKEISVDGYVSNVELENNLSIYYFDVINTYVEPDTINVDVKKVWDDEDNYANKRPTEIEVGLFDSDGKQYGDAVKLNNGNSWKHTWTNLDPDEEWTIKEINVPDGYTDTVKNLNSNSGEFYFQLTNTYPVTYPHVDNNPSNPQTPNVVDVEVQKVWEDNDDFYKKRPQSIIVGLYSNDGTVFYDKVVLSNENGWYYKWEDLAYGDWEVKEIYIYENYDVVHYEITDGDSDFSYGIKNVYKEQTTITEKNPSVKNVEVRKVWENDRANYILNSRPESVEIVLYRDGVIFDNVLLKEENNWEYIWANLEGEYTWSVKEINVPSGYSVSYSEEVTPEGVYFVVTNGYGYYPPKIPQTGVDWSLSILAGLGLIMLSGGLILDNRIRRGNVTGANIQSESSQIIQAIPFVRKARKTSTLKNTRKVKEINENIALKEEMEKANNFRNAVKTPIEVPLLAEIEEVETQEKLEKSYKAEIVELQFYKPNVPLLAELEEEISLKTETLKSETEALKSEIESLKSETKSINVKTANLEQRPKTVKNPQKDITVFDLLVRNSKKKNSKIRMKPKKGGK